MRTTFSIHEEVKKKCPTLLAILSHFRIIIKPFYETITMNPVPSVMVAIKMLLASRNDSITEPSINMTQKLHGIMQGSMEYTQITRQTSDQLKSDHKHFTHHSRRSSQTTNLGNDNSFEKNTFKMAVVLTHILAKIRHSLLSSVFI